MVLLDQPSRISPMAKRAAPLNAHGQQTCEASDVANYGLGGTAGSLGGPPAKSRPSAGCKTMLIPLIAAPDRRALVRIEFVPGPIPAVILQGIVQVAGLPRRLHHDIVPDTELFQVHALIPALHDGPRRNG